MVIAGGRIIDPAASLDIEGDLYIAGGRIVRIESIGRIPAGVRSFDARGMIVCPGFVDLHTHLRFPGFPAKETLESAGAAAAAGGFTTVCAMANTRPVVDRVEVLDLITSEARRATSVRVRQLGAVSVDLAGERLTDMTALAAQGAVAFSDDGMPVWNESLMRAALAMSAILRKPVSVHEEDRAVVGSGVANAGERALRLGLEPWPCAGEASMVARDVELLAESGGHLHVAHVSCRETVEEIRRAKARGLRITAEVTPHHLCLDEQLLDGDLTTGLTAAHPCVKVNPPLRTRQDSQALLIGLIDGTIDAVATDHAPHAATDKEGAFQQAAFGFSALETALPLLLGLVRDRRLDLMTMIDRLTRGPATVFHLPGGTLRVGAPADVCVFDPDEPWTVTAESLHSRGKNTPLLGREMLGRVRMTIVGGRVTYQGNAEPAVP